MANFLERIGRTAPRNFVQVETLDNETRVRLWNCLFIARQQMEGQRGYSHTPDLDILRIYWASTLHRPIDEFPEVHYDRVWEEIKKSILEEHAYEALNTIEEFLKTLDDEDVVWRRNLANNIRELNNQAFERFMVGFRFIQGEIAPIDTTAEAESVIDAIEDAGIVPGARRALEKATGHLADREDPDFANSVKESISAVESIVRALTGQGSLGDGLKVLERKGVKIHPALRRGWNHLYGWTSDDNGIRHANIDPDDVDQSLAKYMLVTCSAFVSFLLEEATKQGFDWETQPLRK